MLTIGMENFQSVRAMQELPISGITLVYGNNSSGKSIIKDVLEMGSGMGSGPAFHRPADEWVNFRARELNEPVKLSYSFLMKDIFDTKEFILSCVLGEAFVGNEFATVIDVDRGDKDVSILSDYLFESLVRVEYTWSADGFLLDNEEYSTKTEISIGRAGGDNFEVLAKVFCVQEGGVLISFNEGHELIGKLSGSLKLSEFIGGEDLTRFCLEPDGVFLFDPILERYRSTKKTDVLGEKEADIGFILVVFCAIGVNHCVSSASEKKYVGDIRQGSESPKGDRYSGEEYWEKLKLIVLQGELGCSSFLGELERINKWLGGIDYLNSGYELAGEFRFLVGLEDLKSIGRVGCNSLVSEISNYAGLSYSKLMLRDLASGRKLDFSDVGTGISQVLPILYYMSLSGRSGQSVYIQQPELHLHPKLQASMAQIFIESFVTNDKSRNYIIETHSELVVLRILKVIRKNYGTKNLLKERALLADDVNVIFAVKDCGGVTTYKHLRISKNGDFLDKWPDGFFEERDQELF